MYASLLHFLSIHSQQQVDRHDAPSLVVATGESSIEQYQRESYDVVKEELSGLLSVLCCEATAGHHLCRMLSLTCLSAIAAVERRAVLGTGSLLSSYCSSALLDQLSQQGQLRRLLDGLEQDDAQLATLVTSGGDLRPLYVCEARCALLAQLALTPDGARQLLQAGLMARLSKMQVLSCGLEAGGGVTLGAIKSAVRICQAVVSSLGSQDWSAGSQIADFLTSHMATIGGILQPPSPGVPLETAALVAGVVASTAAAGQTNTSVLLLYQQLTSLLPHLLQQPQADAQGGSDDPDGLLLRLQIISSCLTCCSHHLLVSPRTVTFHPLVDTRSTKTLTLGTLLQALRFAIRTFKEAKISDSANNNPSSSNDNCTTAALKQQQLSAHITECGTFILWRHLHTFLQGGSQQPLLQASAMSNFLQGGPQSLLQTPSMSVALPPQSLTLSPLQAASLKEQVGEAFSDLVTDLQNLHQQFSATTSHVTFLPAVTTRVRKMLVT